MADLFRLLLELLIEIFGWILFGALQGFIGIVWPSDDPRVRRLQRWCSVLLGAGLASAGGAVACHLLGRGGAVGPLALVAAALFVASGLCGGVVEWMGRK